MNPSYCLLIAGLTIGGLNLHSAERRRPPVTHVAVTWPTEFEGRPLHRLPLSDLESAFTVSFPGAIAQFQCGDDQLILRQVDRATRKLHSSATCLKAAGFHLTTPATRSHEGNPWLTYKATRGSKTLGVREQIRSLQDRDATWTDVSQWFWNATLHPNNGPWIAVTVLQNRDPSRRDRGPRMNDPIPWPHESEIR